MNERVEEDTLPRENQQRGHSETPAKPGTGQGASERKKIETDAKAILFTVTIPVANFRLGQDKEEFEQTMGFIAEQIPSEIEEKDAGKPGCAKCLKAMQKQHARINKRRQILLENELTQNLSGREEPGRPESTPVNHNADRRFSLTQEFDAFHFALESGGFSKDPSVTDGYYSNPSPWKGTHDSWERNKWRKKVHSANILIPHEWVKPPLRTKNGAEPTLKEIKDYVRDHYVATSPKSGRKSQEPCFSVTFGAIRRRFFKGGQVANPNDRQNTEVLRKHDKNSEGKSCGEFRTCREDFNEWLERLLKIDPKLGEVWVGVKNSETGGGSENNTLHKIVAELQEELDILYRGFGVYVAGVEVRRYPSIVTSRTPADTMWDYVNIYFGFDPKAPLVSRGEVVDQIDLRRSPNMLAAGIRRSYGVEKNKEYLDKNPNHRYWLSRSLGKVTNYLINILGYSSHLTTGGFVKHELDNKVVLEVTKNERDSALRNGTEYWLNRHVGYKASQVMTTTTVMHGSSYYDVEKGKSFAYFDHRKMYMPWQWEDRMKYVMGYACASGNTITPTQFFQYDPEQMKKDCCSQFGFWSVWTDRSGVAYQYLTNGLDEEKPDQVHMHEFAKLDGICLQHSRYLDAMITARRQSLFLEHHSQLLMVATKKLRFFEGDKSRKSLRDAVEHYRLLQADFVNFLARLWFQTMNGAPDASALLKQFQGQLQLKEHIEEIRSEEESCSRFVESLDDELHDLNMRVIAILTIILLPLTTWYTVTGGFTQTLQSFKAAYWGGVSAGTGGTVVPAGTRDFALQVLIVLLLIFGGIFVFRTFGNAIGRSAAGYRHSSLWRKLWMWTKIIICEWSFWVTLFVLGVFVAVVRGLIPL